MKPNERILVILLALLNFTYILDFMIIMPLGNFLMPKWNINTSQFSIIVSSYSIAAFLSSFFAIFFADKFDRKKLLIFAYSWFLVGTLGCAMAINYNTMLVARLFTGFFGGIIGAQVLSIIGDIIPYERRGQAMGLLMGGFALASVIGVPFGLFLADKLGWHFPFLLVVILGIVLIPFLLKFIPKVNAHLSNPVPLRTRIKTFLLIFKDKTQMTALFSSAFIIMGHFIIIPLINPYMVYNVGVPQKFAPFIYLVGGASSFLTAQFAGKLADQYGKKKVFIMSALISMIFVFAITNMPQWPVLVVLLIFGLWFSSATARTVPSQAMITQAVPTNTRGSFMSLNSCFQSLGQGFATLLSGWITYNDANFKIYNYPILGYISIFLIMTCILLINNLDRFINEKIIG